MEPAPQANRYALAAQPSEVFHEAVDLQPLGRCYGSTVVFCQPVTGPTLTQRMALHAIASHCMPASLLIKSFCSIMVDIHCMRLITVHTSTTTQSILHSADECCTVQLLIFSFKCGTMYLACRIQSALSVLQCT